MDEIHMIGAGIGALLVAGVAVKMLTGRGGSGPPGRRAVNRALAAGNVRQAAALAAQNGDLEAAYDLYVRLQDPHNAAQIALRQGKAALAGELFEKAGDRGRAAAAYRQAGLTLKANELEPPRAIGGAAYRADSKPPARIAGPVDRAQEAENQWRAAAKEVRPGDAEAKERLAHYAEAAAEAWLSAGEIKRAAELCREAGLVDQAVNLYVNVLGDPGAAAQLLSSRGDHKRAAELFELAGQKERSLQAWIDWSKGAEDPLACADDVKRLGRDAPAKLLTAIVAERPLTPSTMDLYYRVALRYEEAHDPSQARAVLERVSSIDPGYRDVKDRVSRLQTAATQLALPSDRPASSGEPATKPLSSAPPRAPLAPDVLDGLVQDAATRAAEMIKRNDATMLAAGQGPAAAVPATVRGSSHPGAVATEGGGVATAVSGPPVVFNTFNLTFRIIDDQAVKEARRGPTVGELRAQVGTQQPSSSNLELFYRLALALAAHGQFEEAGSTFKTIESIAPGFRDARARVEQIESWKQDVQTHVLSGAAKQLASRYKLLGELGRGGMAVVFRARDEALGREVALKFLTESAVGNEVFMQFFQREARAAGSLNHPNIVTIYDVGTLDGRAFICMEFVDGVSLDSVLERDKRMPLLESLRVIEQVLVALEYAHGKQIIHRDIKPANIMRTAHGHVKLMDFGLAKSLTEGKKTTVISGTPSYMSPEQLVGKNVDARADLFSVGATLYEMLTGEVPFAGMVRSGPPKSVRATLPVAPSKLDEILLRSMEFAIERRFASATEMLVPVRQILSGLEKHRRDAAPILVPAGTPSYVPPPGQRQTTAPPARASVAPPRAGTAPLATAPIVPRPAALPAITSPLNTPVPPAPTTEAMAQATAPTVLGPAVAPALPAPAGQPPRDKGE
jgi:tetratricopeptide (TPR) repeat protein